MKRVISILPLVLFAFYFSSCTGEHGLICKKGNGETITEERDLKDFTSVSLSMDADIILIQGSEFKVEVKGSQNLVPMVRTRVSGGNLDVDLERGSCIRGSSDIVVYVTAPKFDGASIAGSGTISNQNALTGDNILCSIAGSGDIVFNDISFINLDNKIAGSGSIKIKSAVADKLDNHISGSGSIEISGMDTASYATITISGSGDLRTFDLPTKDVDIKISGSGKAQVMATGTLNATISGSGDVEYKGSPSVNTNVSGSGKVIKVN